LPENDRAARIVSMRTTSRGITGERMLADAFSLIGGSFLNRARASLLPRAVDRRLNLCILSAGCLTDGEPSLGAAPAIAGRRRARACLVLEQDREGGTS
jgi:hypothetical protein